MTSNQPSATVIPAATERPAIAMQNVAPPITNLNQRSQASEGRYGHWETMKCSKKFTQYFTNDWGDGYDPKQGTLKSGYHYIPYWNLKASITPGELHRYKTMATQLKIEEVGYTIDSITPIMSETRMVAGASTTTSVFVAQPTIEILSDPEGTLIDHFYYESEFAAGRNIPHKVSLNNDWQMPRMGSRNDCTLPMAVHSFPTLRNYTKGIPFGQNNKGMVHLEWAFPKKVMACTETHSKSWKPPNRIYNLTKYDENTEHDIFSMQLFPDQGLPDFPFGGTEFNLAKLQTDRAFFPPPDYIKGTPYLGKGDHKLYISFQADITYHSVLSFYYPTSYFCGPIFPAGVNGVYLRDDQTYWQHTKNIQFHPLHNPIKTHGYKDKVPDGYIAKDEAPIDDL